MGVDVVGTNCSLGPDQMQPVVQELLTACECPVMAEPNAGLPELRDNVTVFPLGPEDFAQKTAPFAHMPIKKKLPLFKLALVFVLVLACAGGGWWYYTTKGAAKQQSEQDIAKQVELLTMGG